MGSTKIPLLFGFLVVVDLALGAQFCSLCNVLSEKLKNVTLPDLDIPYDSLEPWIDAATMRVHHGGHHAAYSKKTEAIVQAWRASGINRELAAESLVTVFRNLKDVPPQWSIDLGNHGGGFVNHVLYFATLSSNPGQRIREPLGAIANLIRQSYGKFEYFKEYFDGEAMKIFGSGWLWLCREPKQGRVTVMGTTNQQTPISYGLQPLLTIDLWEHAYYLKHQNKRLEYIDSWWHVVDWDKVEQLLQWWLNVEPPPKDEL